MEYTTCKAGHTFTITIHNSEEAKERLKGKGSDTYEKTDPEMSNYQWCTWYDLVCNRPTLRKLKVL